MTTGSTRETTPGKTLLPLGHKDTKDNRPGAPNTMLRLFSLGVATGGDTYLYSFDEAALADQVEKMTAIYEQRRKAVHAGSMTLEEATTQQLSTPHQMETES